MKKISQTIFFVSIFILLNHCGFKVAKIDAEKNFNIISFKDIGNKNINYIIERNLEISEKKQNLYDLDINIETSLAKSIKEKNISNEITKYELVVETKVKMFIVNERKELNFVVTDKDELRASNKMNKQKYNENIILKRLGTSISKKINRKIFTILNDL